LARAQLESVPLPGHGANSEVTPKQRTAWRALFATAMTLKGMGRASRVVATLLEALSAASPDDLPVSAGQRYWIVPSRSLITR
jgi:truncated hemoglobin YjbI